MEIPRRDREDKVGGNRRAAGEGGARAGLLGAGCWFLEERERERERTFPPKSFASSLDPPPPPSSSLVARHHTLASSSTHFRDDHRDLFLSSHNLCHHFIITSLAKIMTGFDIKHALLILCIALDAARGMTVTHQNGCASHKINIPASRRAFISTSAAAATAFASLVGAPTASNARYILNEETGEYDEVTDEDWQTTWNKRIEKAKSMSTDEVFLAAQGAGNVNLKDGQESDAS